MEIVKGINDMRRLVHAARKEHRIIGLVPTMGALHEGHLSLIRRSKEADDFTIVSIFVNPIQFGPAEDFERYPRPFEADVEKCQEAGVDLVFAPAPEVMYPEGFGTYVEVEGIMEVLEGASRPGHFRGVATAVLKLFNLAQPHRAYFGMKDYQQLKVIQKMVRDLNLEVEIVPCPTVREPDGLAISSRNAYLSPRERQAALVLYRALQTASRMVRSGEHRAEVVRSAALCEIEAEPLAQVDYVAIVDPETLQPVDQILEKALVALAVRIGGTRLIDNELVEVGGGAV